MSFWSSQTLQSRLRELIHPFDIGCIESSSYGLSLGDEVYISPLPNTPLDKRKKVKLRTRETVPIPPGQFAYLITEERVTIPPDAIAFISIRFKAKSKGLVNVSGFHVDPGYSGKLIFSVYNAGPLNYQIEYGERLFTIWFASLDQEDNKARSSPGYDSIPTEIINSPDLVSSLPYLVERLDALEKRLEAYSIKQAIFFGLAISIALSISGLLIRWIYDVLFTGL